MQKDLKYYHSKFLALRNAMTQILEEMEAEVPAATPRKRQNKRAARVINFEALYNRKKIK